MKNILFLANNVIKKYVSNNSSEPNVIKTRFKIVSCSFSGKFTFCFNLPPFRYTPQYKIPCKSGGSLLKTVGKTVQIYSENELIKEFVISDKVNGANLHTTLGKVIPCKNIGSIFYESDMKLFEILQFVDLEFSPDDSVKYIELLDDETYEIKIIS
jgi:hypothetical protein